jgi:cytochrome c oxidase subunit II
MSAWPMNYLRTYGPRADPATALTWGLIWLSVAVVVIVTVLVAVAIIVRRVRGGASALAGLPAETGPSGMAWITIGLALTVIALIGALAWTLQALAAIDSPATKPALTLDVTGHQWWWEVAYHGGDVSQDFATANEIHIPVGQPVVVRLHGADVIHSFWVPALTGKTETIPGRTNLTWLQADKAGVYRGQCAEYCGVQHAHMAVFVVAQPPAAFAAWRAGQSAAAAPTAATAAGQSVFADHCAVCHTVRGTDAGGIVGPDLTHLMSRQTLAAGALPNTTGALSGWILDPQSAKPGARMPATNLSGPELGQLVAYLETLR